MINEENMLSFLDQLPKEVNEEQQLVNPWGISDDYFVYAILIEDT
jgi:hypothetical protein